MIPLTQMQMMMINMGTLMPMVTMVTRTCGAQTAAFTKDFLDRMATPLAQGHCHDYQVKMMTIMMSEDMLLCLKSKILVSLTVRWAPPSVRLTTRAPRHSLSMMELIPTPPTTQKAASLSSYFFWSPSHKDQQRIIRV